MIRSFRKPLAHGSLTWLMIALLWCVSLPASAQPASEQSSEQQAVAAIEKLGGRARTMSGNDEAWEVEFQLRGQALTDDGLAHVARLNVVRLNLRDTKVTSAGVTHLKGLTNLRRLHLERTAVDDAAAETLAGLVNLEYLNLYKTKISDKTLDRLTGLKKLEKLYVWQTSVTDEGVARLHKALPKLQIVRGVDMSKLPVYTPHEKETFVPKTALKWIATTSRDDAPRSLNGINTRVLFENQSKRRVRVYWVSYGNELQLYGELGPGETRDQNTYAKNTWLITDTNDQPLGYFIVGEESAKAVVPE